MSVDGATAATSESSDQRDGGDSTPNDPYRFLSTRLTRELIAADARAEGAREGLVALAGRMLAIVADGLGQRGAAFLDASDSSVVVSQGLDPEERDVLSGESSGGRALARRALEERRVFLLGSGSREPLLPALREVRGDWAAVVLVPLCDRDQRAGVLALASTRAPLPAAFLRSLAPAFRLLTLVLHPGRFGSGGDEAPGAVDAERYLVEIEDLRARLAEARDQLRDLEVQDSSSQAAQRAEAESLRARVAELEARLASGGAELEARRAAGGEDEVRLEELEEECARRGAALEDRERHVDALERELESLRERLEEAERARDEAEARATAEDALRAALRPLPSEEEDEIETTSLPETDVDELELGQIAEAAAAAIEADAGGAAGEAELVGDEEPAPPEETPEANEGVPEVPALGLWHLGSDPEAQGWTRELAERSGALLWTGDGEAPRTARRLVVMNLFDSSLERTLELAERDRDAESLVYAADPESGQGFELGAVGWIRRPLDPKSALQRIQARVPRRLGGIVVVSAQLRELAGLRQALAEVDAAGSVACDARQATDLLEIVRRPDAVLIDLCLEGGQALGLARHLRSNPETSDVPILFLMPETLHVEKLRTDAERARVLVPYGNEEARRMVNGALARRG